MPFFIIYGLFQNVYLVKQESVDVSKGDTGMDGEEDESKRGKHESIVSKIA